MKYITYRFSCRTEDLESIPNLSSAIGWRPKSEDSNYGSDKKVGEIKKSSKKALALKNLHGFFFSP